ncbi:hypothetical protein [Komagataeibacter diospyri]|nr:hypothetical protein [Komagataeibacter diospyri]
MGHTVILPHSTFNVHSPSRMQTQWRSGSLDQNGMEDEDGVYLTF